MTINPPKMQAATFIGDATRIDMQHLETGQTLIYLRDGAGTRPITRNDMIDMAETLSSAIVWLDGIRDEQAARQDAELADMLTGIDQMLAGDAAAAADEESDVVWMPMHEVRARMAAWKTREQEEAITNADLDFSGKLTDDEPQS